MSQRPDPELHRWWRDLLEKFDPQSSTVAQFCQMHEISVSSFYQWRRRIADRQATRLVPVQIQSDSRASYQQAEPDVAAIVRIGSTLALRSPSIKRTD